MSGRGGGNESHAQIAAFALEPVVPWPRCYYDADLYCGESATRQVKAGPSDQEIVRRGWHIADMCDCPSCPLRVALSAARFKAVGK